VIFLSVAYLAETSFTMGSVIVSSAVYQSEITFHVFPFHCWMRAVLAPLVVGAGNLDRPHHAFKAEFFEVRLIKIKVLEPPADLFSCQRFSAKFGPDRNGAGGAKGGGQGEREPAKHGPGTEPGNRVTGAGARTASFAVTHPRWEPCAGIPLARIWAGGGQ
jgi:hypothetical protein